jgi:hypothetical protein
MRPEFGTPTQEIRLKQQSNIWQYLRLVAAIAVIFLTASASALQSKQTTAPSARKTAPRKTTATDDNKMTGVKVGNSDLAWLQDLLKNKELMAELEKLGQKLKDGVQNPAPRSQSKILSRLPDSTLFYIALPNYGDTLHQAQQIFQQDRGKARPCVNFCRRTSWTPRNPRSKKESSSFMNSRSFWETN